MWQTKVIGGASLHVKKIQNGLSASKPRELGRTAHAR